MPLLLQINLDIMVTSKEDYYMEQVSFNYLILWIDIKASSAMVNFMVIFMQLIKNKEFIHDTISKQSN